LPEGVWSIIFVYIAGGSKVSERVEQMEKILKERGMDILFARVASNLLKKGNLDEAVKICENGLKKYPSYAQAHYVLAGCYLKSNRQNEAKNELERTLRFDPSHLRALRLVAGIYQKSDMKDPYRETLIKLHTLDPLNAEITSETEAAGIKTGWPANENAKQSQRVQPETGTRVEKVDLSQFDNRDDDFTTIISGKTEDSGEDEPDHVPVYEDEKLGEPEPEPDEKDLEFEELEELKFDETGGDETESDKGEEWLGTVNEGEATEIIFEKSGEEKSTGSDDTFKTPEQLSENIVKTGEPDAEEVPAQPKIVSQTLGEILVSQKKYTQALQVFELLKEQHPDNKSLDKKITFLKKIITLEQKH
jgi:tetratricopeptide (TPR) repeat protein